MKLRNLFLAILLFTACGAYAQNAPYRGNQFYVEVGGPGNIFSANFDSRFVRGESLGFGYRVGLGYGQYWESDYSDGYWYDDNRRTYATIPLGINYVFGKHTSPHTFEVGAGATILTKEVSLYADNSSKTGNLIGAFTFMYRRTPIDGGFTWRIGFTPIIGTNGNLNFSMGVGLGYAF